VTAWRVIGPYGERTARGWPLAVDMLCQDLKTTWMRDAGMGERAAELQAWSDVELIEERTPVVIIACGRRHELRRAP
jgi:hypothetical protein